MPGFGIENKYELAVRRDCHFVLTRVLLAVVAAALHRLGSFIARR